MTLTEMVPYEKIVPLQDLRSSIYINEFIPSAGLAFLPTNGSTLDKFESILLYDELFLTI